MSSLVQNTKSSFEPVVTIQLHGSVQPSSEDDRIEDAHYGIPQGCRRNQ